MWLLLLTYLAEMVEFRILSGGSMSKSSITTLDFRRGDFNVFTYLLGRILWDTGLERRGIQESLSIFKDHLVQAQESSIPTSRNANKCSRKPAWMNKELLIELRHKKEAVFTASLCLSLHWEDQHSGIPCSWDQRENRARKTYLWWRRTRLGST